MWRAKKKFLLLEKFSLLLHVRILMILVQQDYTIFKFNVSYENWNEVFNHQMNKPFETYRFTPVKGEKKSFCCLTKISLVYMS